MPLGPAFTAGHQCVTQSAPGKTGQAMTPSRVVIRACRSGGGEGKIIYSCSTKNWLDVVGIVPEKPDDTVRVMLMLAVIGLGSLIFTRCNEFRNNLGSRGADTGVTAASLEAHRCLVWILLDVAIVGNPNFDRPIISTAWMLDVNPSAVFVLRVEVQAGELRS